MKKLRFCFALAATFLFALSAALPVYANMAAPTEPDIGSPITFEKSDEITVRSEVLDIAVDGPEAYITATYRMENTTGEQVSTPAMFIAPNMDGGSVTVDGTNLPFTENSYQLSYDAEVITEDWEYAILSKGTVDSERTTDTIRFNLDFAPRESRDVTVSYTYQLGGWPDLSNAGSRLGEINYYLTPAAMWKDFESLTINLQLDGNLPRITESNFEFEKIGRRTYQCVCDILPKRNLKITLGPNRLASFFNGFWVMLFFPILFPLIIIILVVVLVVLTKRVNKSNRKS